MFTVPIQLKYEDVKNFIQLTTSFESEIDLIKGRYVIDAKSIMGIFSLDFSQQINVCIHTEDEKELNRFKSEIATFQRN